MFIHYVLSIKIFFNCLGTYALQKQFYTSAYFENHVHLVDQVSFLFKYLQAKLCQPRVDQTSKKIVFKKRDFTLSSSKLSHRYT